MKMCLTSSSSLLMKVCFTIYEDESHGLRTSSLFVKMFPTSYAHPLFFRLCKCTFLWRCTSQIMQILAFYEDVPHKLCTSLLFMKVCFTNYAHLSFHNDVSNKLCKSFFYLLKVCHTFYVIANFYGSVPPKLCKSLLFMSMCHTGFAHSLFL